MITSVFSILLSISIINTGAVNSQSISELNVPDTDFTQQTTLTSSLPAENEANFEYFVNVQLPKIKEKSTQEEERVAQIEEDQTKAKQAAMAQIEQEKIRIDQEVARIQKAQAEEEARQKAEQEKLDQIAEQKRKAQVAAAQATAVALPANTDYVTLIRQRCDALGCNSDQLIRVMYCESGGRPNAYNASSGASGLFQFMPSTFTANAARYYPGGSIWDGTAQIYVATAMFANGQAYQWSCK